MGRAERSESLPRNLDKIAHRQRTLEVLQRVTTQVFHDHKDVSLMVQNVIHRDDVRMLQAGQAPGLIGGTLGPAGGFSHFHVNSFDRNPPLQLQVVCKQNLANTSPANLFVEDVTPADHDSFDWFRLLTPDANGDLVILFPRHRGKKACNRFNQPGFSKNHGSGPIKRGETGLHRLTPATT